jgi:two-component system, NtrC family, sensor kinase
MRFSISARIFGGFLVVLLAFSGVMGFTFVRLHRLRQDLQLINKSYLQLTLILGELYALQGNLLNTVAERSGGRGTSKFLRTQVTLARLYRLRDLQTAIKVLRRSEGLAPGRRDLQFMARTEERLRGLEHGFRGNEALFDRLFAGAGPADQATADAVGENLLRLERKLALQMRQLRDDLRGQVKSTALLVEQNEQHTVWAILALAIVAILVSLAVTFGAQLTLRPLKGLVAGTKRIGTGDYAHRVQVQSRNELGVLAREFNSMAAAIEEREHRLIRSERMAAAGQIASHITHEIRNPLSSISLNTELLEEELSNLLPASGDAAASSEPPAGKLDEARNLCRAMRREVDRLTDITEEYLRFARLPRPHLAPEDVNEILQSLLAFMQNELRGKRVEAVYEPQPLPVVEADENQLRQAFLNLLRNAVEAMAARGGTLRVSTCPRDGEVEVRIADTGAGIAELDLPKVFEPFFSTKEKGTGLGLPLTQQIIQEHGGSIGVESIAGQGTVFTVRLPAGRGAPAAVDGGREKLEDVRGEG